MVSIVDIRPTQHESSHKSLVLRCVRYVGSITHGEMGVNLPGPDIFLSYNREDAGEAKAFADAFAREGLEVWWDQTLRSGETYDEVTEAALRGAKAVVVLWSPRSVASHWVRAEATIAHRAKTL